MTIGERIRQARTARRPLCSQARLADELSLARWGIKGQCDRQQVYRWETGRRVPTDWLPWLEHVLDVELSHEQHAPVSDTVTSAILLGRSDVERRQFLTASAAVGLSALDVTDTEALTRRVRRGGPAAVGMGEIAAIRSMTAALGDAASELGGGHARHLAVRYLAEDVKRWLEGTYTEKTGRELLAATSQLVHLIGWMARDAGQQGAAQRYHVHSYKLAAEAGENELAATALRGLADQAIDLGHVAAAVRLAEACEQRGHKLNNTKALAYYRNTCSSRRGPGHRRKAADRLSGRDRAGSRAARRILGLSLQPRPVGTRIRDDSREDGRLARRRGTPSPCSGHSRTGPSAHPRHRARRSRPHPAQAWQHRRGPAHLGHLHRLRGRRAVRPHRRRLR